MDVEDEPNSYLKYLNDSDTPNTYLLGNNEVGLFSVEPIFTEMEATDWPQEGFPLLLTNSLITEDSTEDQDNNSQSSDKNIVNETLYHNIIMEPNENTVPDSSDIKNLEVQNIIEIQPVKKVQLDGNSLLLNQDKLLLEQKHVQLKNVDMKLSENCRQVLDNRVQLDENILQLRENEAHNGDSLFRLDENRLLVSENPKPHAGNTLIEFKPNEEYIILNENSVDEGRQIVMLVNSDKTPLPKNNSVLKSSNLPFIQKKQQFTWKKGKSVNDLFSTVIANKCKICCFLCEDLEQIKRHISEKHPECLFTHNGISSGVSILLSNAKKKNAQNGELKKECTVFICSECHVVCTDKNDLKQHMIKIHNLTTENVKAHSTEKNKKTEETRTVLKKTTILSDINASLVKNQEKALQRVKCKVPGCGACFPTEELCESHMKLHMGEGKNLFRCKDCEVTFKLWRIARGHMYNMHGIDFGMIVCPMCNIFRSYKAATMLQHMLIHKEQKPFECRECGKSFKQPAQLKNHEILHRIPEDMPTWSIIKKCDKCQRFFANSKSLKSHIQSVHDNFKPFICNICGHKSSRKAMLELHLRQHTGFKPHKCQHCEYKTGDHNCLRKHVMKHVGAFTYQCPYCSYRCIQAGSIKSHLSHKHKGKSGLFSCKYCSYTTINSTFLESHEKNHEISLTKGATTDNTSIERTNETDLQTDEETQSCFLNTEPQIEETVDNGGITIPAGLEMQLVS